MRKKFIRTDYLMYTKLGKNRKKLQRWRRPTGRHNKIRTGMAGHPPKPAIGFKKPKNKIGLIQGLKLIRIFNVGDLEKVKKDNIAVIAKIGARKKLEVIKKAQEMKIKILNLGGKNEVK